MAKTTDKAKGWKFEKCDTGKKGYLTYDELAKQMLPPEINALPDV